MVYVFKRLDGLIFLNMDNEPDKYLKWYAFVIHELRGNIKKIMGSFKSADHLEILQSYSVQHFLANHLSLSCKDKPVLFMLHS